MKFLFRATVVLALAILLNSINGQETESPNEDSEVLLTLRIAENDEPLSLTLDDVNDLDESFKDPEVFQQPSSPSPFQPSVTPRPSLIQSFLSGRLNTASPRPSRLGELFRNYDVSGRLSRLRERIGRFRIPRLETNDDSLPYRAGRRISLFFQRVWQRLRSFTEGLRARAATATPIEP